MVCIVILIIKQSDLNPWGTSPKSANNPSSLPLPSPPSYNIDNSPSMTRSTTQGSASSDPWTVSTEAANLLTSTKPTDKRENITNVIVEICTEKGGNFLLKHVNYKVFSPEVIISSF
jgi:hypothetical protein